ncbi:hypothetical protein MXB_295 [Myxobolus squamalis]|nr:hypothetical protein MXB_295 [Myxobolus squamalis]
MAIEKPTKLSIYEVAFWFFNVPLQNISQLRKYMHNLGSIIYQNFINTDSKITFFENYLPLILVLTKIWQQKLIDDLICEDYSNILNICGMAYPTNTVDCGSFIEDYFHLFSTVF